MPRKRPAQNAALVLASLAGAALLDPSAHAQTIPDSIRGDEIGPREMDLDEEAFLNLLSFAQPLESVQPFLAADAGWQLALGSVTADTLWYDHELKLKANVVDAFAIRVRAHQGLDLDGDFTRVSLQPELALGDHWSLGAPLVLAGDKGSIDAGLAWTWRDPATGCDFVQLAWIRADSAIDEVSDRFETVEVVHHADNLSLQLQARLLPWGKTTLLVNDATPSRIRYIDDAEEQRLSAIHARLLQSIEWSETQRGFVDAEYEAQSEQSTPLGPEGFDEAFEGDRDLFRVNAEWQRDEPGLAPDERPRRLRFGAQFLNYREDAESPAVPGTVVTPAVDDSELRSEFIGYAGWRAPLFDSKRVDCETVVYLDRVSGRHRSRTSASDDVRHPAFQGKLSFYFRWQATPTADFVLSPSFELDTFGWGGGALMFRCRL
ncbi:MAG: hypothetical protein EXS13_15150 [Planctomycetes bacterium]|nr:hypothetical protein [Planctomycetota bacterium]